MLQILTSRNSWSLDWIPSQDGNLKNEGEKSNDSVIIKFLEEKWDAGCIVVVLEFPVHLKCVENEMIKMLRMAKKVKIALLVRLILWQNFSSGIDETDECSKKHAKLLRSVALLSLFLQHRASFVPGLDPGSQRPQDGNLEVKMHIFLPSTSLIKFYITSLPNKVSISQFIILKLTILDVLAHPVAKILALLQLLVWLSCHWCLLNKTQINQI